MSRSLIRPFTAVAARGGRRRPRRCGPGQVVRRGGGVTFTVGTTQDIDSLNVTAGCLVIDYEIWNLTLPTLTDKAADDFAINARPGRVAGTAAPTG